MLTVFNFSSLPEQESETYLWVSVFDAQGLITMARGQPTIILVDENTNRTTLKETFAYLSKNAGSIEIAIVGKGFPVIKNRYFEVATVAKIQPQFINHYLKRKERELCQQLSLKSTPSAALDVTKYLDCPT